MNASHLVPRLVAAVALLAGSIAAVHAQQYGPTPYASFADSPFRALFPGSFAYFYLDDFESSTRTPGYSVSGGRRLDPGEQTDSVDWDGPNNTGSATDLVGSGSLNGSGTEGSSWYSGGSPHGTSSLTFTFDAAQLGGRLPTHVGIVWTDVGEVFDSAGNRTVGIADVVVEAFGTDGVLLGPISATLGDGSTFGGTEEDRFFGFAHLPGIESLTIRTLGSIDWEVDHLQYAALIPEPEQWLLMALGLGALAWRARRRA